jgi:protein TonB
VIRREISPALAGSLLLHGTVAAALLISWPWARKLEVGSVVPVTIVANAPAADPRPAVEAPIPQEAMTEAPVLDAPPEVTPPEPIPTPTPPTPTPPTPAPKAAQKPAPKTPAAKPEKPLDLAALEASVSKLIRPSKAKPAAAPKGPTRAETATTARETPGTGADVGAAMAQLGAELQRRWNPNCEVEGGRNIVVRVVFTLNTAGQVVGEPSSLITAGPQSSVGKAAAERAVRAVYAAAPFRNLPREFYGDRIAVNFNAREACST